MPTATNSFRASTCQLSAQAVEDAEPARKAQSPHPLRVPKSAHNSAPRAVEACRRCRRKMHECRNGNDLLFRLGARGAPTGMSNCGFVSRCVRRDTAGITKTESFDGVVLNTLRRLPRYHGSGSSVIVPTPCGATPKLRAKLLQSSGYTRPRALLAVCLGLVCASSGATGVAGS